MDRFLKALEEALRGEMSDAEVRANVDYYRTYIRSEKNKGRTEAEVLGELGDARLIARSIIDANAISGRNTYNVNYDRSDQGQASSADSRTDDGNSQGFFKGREEKRTKTSSFRRTSQPASQDPDGGYGCFGGGFLFALIAFLIIFVLLIVLFSKIVLFLLPAILVIALIIWIVRKLS